MSQTVSFQCGHCHKVMGVTSAYLGKQVRCPHCKNVVMAPAQAPAPAPAPAPVLTAPAPVPSAPAPILNFSAGPPSRDEHESIFGEQVADDLFDTAPKPKIELPPESDRPNLQLEPTVFHMPGLPATDALSAPPAPSLGPTESVPSPVQIAPAPVNNVPAPVANDWGGTAPTAAAGSDGAAQMPAPVARVPTRPADTTNTTLLWYLLYILAGYALLMTIVSLYYYTQFSKAPHPMEILPDEGKPGSKSLSRIIQRENPTRDLSARLKLSLGQTLTLGDLEVTPVKVEQKLIRFDYRNGQTNSAGAEQESLVLHLKLKNVSEKTSFRPTDCSFDYEWKEDRDPEKTQMPYTHLAANGHYYSGPISWRPSVPATLINPRNDNLRNEYIDGQKDDEKILKPGEEAETVVVTDPADKVLEKLSNFTGKMEWRVQLRRGFVPWDGKNISCTAVIGVNFDMSQVEKK